jgi:hypothetical protein
MREHASKQGLAIPPDPTHHEIGAAPILASTVRPVLEGQAGPERQAA